MITNDRILEAGLRDGAPIRVRERHLDRILDMAWNLNPGSRNIIVDSESFDPDIDWTATEVPDEAIRLVAEKVRIDGWT